MNIDWSQLITKAAKQQAEAERILASAVAQAAHFRAIADRAIAPLQDAVDIDEATAEGIVLLKAWKKFRVELSRLPEQSGYPANIVWPVAPA